MSTATTTTSQGSTTSQTRTAGADVPRRILVVGNGMAGARLAEELRHRDPSGGHLHVTVVGEEPHAAYNRVLLSSVVAGSLTPRETRLKPDGWWAARGIRVVTGVRVTSVDTAARTATLTPASPSPAFPLCRPNTAFVSERTGMPLSSEPNAAFTPQGVRGQQGVEGAQVVEWDELVLATGSTSFVPSIEGLDADHLLAGAVPGVVAFRTVDDCGRIVQAAGSARRAVVLGGGLLGLEAARGLLARGVAVTVVHPQGHPMDRQLDADGGAVLTRVVNGLGARLVLGRFAVAHRPPTGDTGAEVVLDDGTTLAADLVIVAAGVRPRTDLAARLGVEVNRAIVVDDQLRTSLPHIHAIGECAEHRGEVPGLVQPGWDQARVLADVLSGADPDATYAGTSVLTRLKAHDIDLASMGSIDVDVHDADHEVLAFTDPSRGRYAKLVLRSDRLVGAILLGVGDAAGALTQLYDTGAPAPRDRLVLMLGRAVTRSSAPESVSLAEMPGSAVICRCNTVTKSAIVAAHRDGADTVPAVAEATRATTGCGGCTSAVEGLCSWLRSTDPAPGPDAAPGPSTAQSPSHHPAPAPAASRSASNAVPNAALNEGAA